HRARDPRIQSRPRGPGHPRHPDARRPAGRPHRDAHRRHLRRTCPGRRAGRDDVPRRPPPQPHPRPAPYPHPARRRRPPGRRAGRRRAVLRPQHPGRARRPAGHRPSCCGAPGDPRRPRPPGAADPPRLRRQEPAQRPRRARQRATGRDRRRRRGDDRIMRHLLDTKTLAREDALRILDVAEDMADTQQREMKKLPALRGKTVVNLFFEDSTRTRISFEAAAKRLSADVINFSAKGSSLSKGESLQDTAQTLQAMGADAVVIRHGASGAPRTLATSGWISAGVVNAGDGTHEHPTQALLDAFTIRKRRFGADSRGRDLQGVSVAIVGDILHSRVARSNVWLLRTLGAEVTLVAPPTLVPQDVSTWPARVVYDLDDALAEGADALMMLRIQLERMNAAYFPTEREYSRRWGLDPRRLTSLGADSIVLHPGPMNRGLEISAEAADSARSTVLDQVTNGVSVRMAALYLLLAGERDADDREDVR